MDSDILKHLRDDTDGLLTYEFLANNIAELSADEVNGLADNLIRLDKGGQFTASAARYLHATMPDTHRGSIDLLIGATIDKDRERKYLPDLLTGIYGKDYEENRESLMADNNFRRIYKRLNNTAAI